MTMLHDKVVLITGAGSGLGRRLALAAAARGATVVGWDLDRARLDLVVKEIDAVAPGRGHGYVCDVSDRAAVAGAARTVTAEVGAVDVLVNNAGVVSGRLLGDLTDEQILRTFSVNTLALYWTTRAFLPAMIDKGAGHVVTLASAAGLVGVAKQTDYSASKHAAVGFDESLRAELRRHAPGVRTTVVCPFYIDTGMFAGTRGASPLLPILNEQKVTDKIVAAIEKDRPRLTLPPVVGTLPLMRILPTRVMDRVLDVLGVNRTMDEFVGRQPARD